MERQLWLIPWAIHQFPNEFAYTRNDTQIFQHGTLIIFWKTVHSTELCIHMSCVTAGSYSRQITSKTITRLGKILLTSTNKLAAGNGCRIYFSLSLFLFCFVFIIFIAGNSAWKGTQTPVNVRCDIRGLFWIPVKTVDGAEAKWSYIAVRGCQRFNNCELLCCSPAATRMQMMLGLVCFFFFFGPLFLSCCPFIVGIHSAPSLFTLFSLFTFKINHKLSFCISLITLRFIQPSLSAVLPPLLFLSLLLSSPLASLSLALSTDLWGCSCLLSHPNLTTSAL